MIPRRKRASEDGTGALRALHSVLRETGGHAKVAELYRLIDADERTVSRSFEEDGA